MFKRMKLNSAMARLVEEKLYEMAIDELGNGNVRKGIWAKAIAKSNGNKEQEKSKYLELRVESLKDEAQVIQSIVDSLDGRSELIENNTSGLSSTSKPAGFTEGIGNIIVVGFVAAIILSFYYLVK
jgi:tetrahydromethanopterin S-methyltransferase subunit F